MRVITFILSLINLEFEPQNHPLRKPRKGSLMFHFLKEKREGKEVGNLSETCRKSTAWRKQKPDLR